jgi:hypothetical protein
MKTQQIAKNGMTLLTISIAIGLTSIGILICYWNASDNSDNDSYCYDCPPITQQELKAGWYWGFENQKKPGTPSSWIHVGGESLSARWIDPNLISDIINQSIPLITLQELTAGWYFGDLNQKKPGTPWTWLHKDEGTRSAMWFDPNIIEAES